MSEDLQAELEASLKLLRAAQERSRAYSEMREEQERHRRLLAGEPPPMTPDQMRTEAARLRAENDALEVEQIADHS